MRQVELAPEVSQVVGQHAQLQSHFVRSETMARQPHPVGRLLAFFDPLLRRAAVVVETYDRAAREGPVGHDETDSGEQLTLVCFALATMGVVQLSA